MSAGRQRAVLVAAGLDPSGGAGLLADEQTIAAHGFAVAGVAMALTVQDSGRCHASLPIDGELIERQVAALVLDLDIAAVKIGMVGSADGAAALADYRMAIEQPEVSEEMREILDDEIKQILAPSKKPWWRFW